MDEPEFCAGCLRDNEETKAVAWCSNCSEWVCKRCVLFDRYALLADDHVNIVSYFPFMSIKKVILHFLPVLDSIFLFVKRHDTFIYLLIFFHKRSCILEWMNRSFVLDVEEKYRI
jgi:hypothetical protein